MMRDSALSVLVLYNGTQTFTNTVWSHLESFRRFSRHRVFFAHLDPLGDFRIDLRNFDAVLVHYSLRLPYDQLSTSCVTALKSYKGIKGAFQQDEYDLTNKIRGWVQALELDLMMTCVPERHIPLVYDPDQFPGTRFASNLTGYVPMDVGSLMPPVPLADRRVVIGYRGRPLPYWYGALAQEKVTIAQRMRTECETRGVPVDIEWSEDSRIYGDGWFDFLRHCRAVLGTESGSNLFDDDGSIRTQVARAIEASPGLTYEEAERQFFPGRDRPGLMNQVSPRIFEAAALKVALVLFEGEYSGVVEPGRHFIALRKDFSNVDEVLRLLLDDAYVEELTQRTLEEVVLSGRYGYPEFVARIDGLLEELAVSRSVQAERGALLLGEDPWQEPSWVSTMPIRARPVACTSSSSSSPSETALTDLQGRQRLDIARTLYRFVPMSVRQWLSPRWRRLLGR